MVRALAARRGQRRRPGATDPPVRAPRHQARTGPGRARGRMAVRAGMATGAGARPRCSPPLGGGDEVLAVRPDVGTSAWISCAGRLPWGQPQDQRADDAWSLTYDWPVGDAPIEVLGYPSRAAPAPVRCAGGVAVGQAERRLPGRHVCAGDPGLPQPHPPLELHRRRRRCRSTRRSTSSWSWKPPRTSSRPATDPPGAGRDGLAQHVAASDARHADRRPRLDPPRAPRRSTARPPIADPPTFHEPAPAAVDDRRPTAACPIWRLEHDVLARTTTAVVDYGGTYRGNHGVTGDRLPTRAR